MGEVSGASWRTFVRRLDQTLRGLEGSGGDGPCGLKVVFSPTAVEAAEGHVLVGVGRWKRRLADGSWADVRHRGVCLNNKGAPLPGGPVGSVSELVLGAGDDLWAAWREAVGRAADPAEFFRTFVLEVEDASPDSCLGLVLFLALLNGVAVGELPAEWVEYARRWERGEIEDRGDLHGAWGPLHNALVHARLHEDLVLAGESSEGGTDPGMGRAWSDALRLVVGGLRVGLPPHELGRGADWPELARARALLEYERQQYAQALEHAIRLQLLLPMADTDGRYRLLDAYLEEEHTPLGCKKVFLRTDTEHTWLRNGFGLMGMYRPGERGTGNDMVVSVDPAAGVHLRDLWEELESMEDERWSGRRPCDDPRRGIAAYPNGRRPGGLPSPNEPWWDDHGRYTLVAAPKRLPSGEPGSRLAWEDVCEALWRVYNPVRALRIRPHGSDEACALHECAGPQRCPCEGPAGKRLLIAHWVREKGNPQSLMLTPTVLCYLAACVNRGPRKQGPVSLEEVLAAGDHDVVPLPGGLAVITDRGAFLVDDWRSRPLGVDALQNDFMRVAERLAALETLGGKVEALVGTVGRYVRSGQRSGFRDVHLFEQLTAVKVRIREVLTETLPRSSGPETAAFRVALEKRWGIADRLEALYEAVGEAETILRDHSEFRTNRLIGWLTLYGFPAAVLAGFFGFLFEGLPSLPWRRPSAWPGGVHWFGMALYGALTVAGVLALRWALGRGAGSTSARDRDGSADPPGERALPDGPRRSR